MTYHGFDIEGKAALITGGTSGLGRAIALGFARAGARVFAGSRDEGKVADADASLRAVSDRNEALSMDVTDAEEVENAVRRVVDKAGRLDILVNAAGILHRGPSIDVAIEDFERVIRINLTGTFISCQAAARVMREQESGGAIVNIASLSSYVGLAHVAAYGASKAAVVQLTKSLANDWAPYRIRVNAVAPGVFPTPLNRRFIEGTERGNWFLQHTPLKRFGEPEELVGAAIYLASPAASFVTGETLTVDGGFLASGVPAELT